MGMKRTADEGRPRLEATWRAARWEGSTGPGGVRPDQLVEELALPDHPERLARHPLLYPRIVLDGVGRPGEGIDLPLEPDHLSSLRGGLPLELEEIQGTVLTALEREEHGQRQHDQRRPTPRRHSG